MTSDPAALPCSAPECSRPRGHAPTCGAPASCPGCLTVCYRCGDDLLTTLRLLPTLHADLGRVLAVMGPEGIELREAVLDAKLTYDRESAEVYFLCNWLENRITPAMQHESAGVFCAMIARRKGEAMRAAYAVRHRGVVLGACPLEPFEDGGDDEHCAGAVVFESCGPDARLDLVTGRMRDGYRPEPRCVRCWASQSLSAWREAGLEPAYGWASEEVATEAVKAELGIALLPQQLRGWSARKEVAYRKGADGARLYEVRTVVEKAAAARQAETAARVRAACKLPREQRFAAVAEALSTEQLGTLGLALMGIIGKGKGWDATSEAILALLFPVPVAA